MGCKVAQAGFLVLLLSSSDAAKLPSMSVSPSAEMMEGSSVTLTCSSDANPAAENTLFKGNQRLPLGSGGTYYFTSISSEDKGIYDYAPKLPSVSVSPSGEIMEGSSVTLTCSSDANPAANYTWYKENEDSPKASGQIFTITDFRAEHSGNYYCEAQNTRGRQNSTLYLSVSSRKTALIPNVNFVDLESDPSDSIDCVDEEISSSWNESCR